jgi:DNA processing protein
MGKAHYLALSTIPNVGSVTVRRLIERCGSVEAIFDAPDEELLRVPRITADIVERLRAVSLDAIEEELAALSEEGLGVLTWDDDDYPANLRRAHDAPPLLFVRGELLPTDELAVAIVGTRQPTPPAVTVAETLARELAERGLTIVSGLAIGVDTAAHRGALLAENGRTLAVPGSGLRVIHPRENIPLAEAIVRRGALLSEFHPNTTVRASNLMARDRVVSGLSRAVIVVEAAEKSGSLDTAAKAKRQGRLLFAVPGSAGTDWLIAQGAEGISLQSDVLDRLVQRVRDTPADGGSEQLSLL